MNRTHTVIDSPIGDLTLVGDDDGLVALYMVQQRHRPGPETFGEPDATAFDAVREQLGEYFEGTRTDFDLPLSLHGTPFQLTVWHELLKIPYGETISYGELAARLGNPSASRAVGLANGKNPVSIVVPCHRVVGSKGDLTGYGGGIERKQHLLGFERKVSAVTLF
jgi:methylated-DNA-[protein]-cysteine S-methyltransferase